MLNDKTVAVVVPCYNEEKQIGIVIETMPDFVDRIIIVNDNSTDKTAETVQLYIEANQLYPHELKKKHGKVKENRFNRAEMVVQ